MSIVRVKVRGPMTPVLSADERAALTAGRVISVGKEYPSALKVGLLCGWGETKARRTIVGLEIKEMWPYVRVVRKSGPPPIDDEPTEDGAGFDADSVGRPGGLTLGQIADRLATVARVKTARLLAGLDPTIPPEVMDEILEPADSAAARHRAARPKVSPNIAPRIRTPGTERVVRVYRIPTGFRGPCMGDDY